jgi:PAS domain S-box-containing protein
MQPESTIAANILLVDDRPQNLLALQAILEPLGQNLVQAQSGEEALRLLLVEDFALLILDVMMPGLDGLETARLIKEREKTRHIPIILLTAFSQQDHAVFKGYDVGAVDYITKPVHPDILRSKVVVFVDLWRKTEQLRRQTEILAQVEKRERVRAVEEQRRLGERRYQELAESMPQIVWTTDAHGRVAYCNHRCAVLTGVNSDTVRERGWQVVLHPEDADRFVQGWALAVRVGKSYEASHRLKCGADNTYRWHLWRALPLRDSSGQISSWIGTSTDIDDQRRRSDALSFLAAASTVLSSRQDVQSTLREIPPLALQWMADWCAIDLVEEDGTIRRAAFLHHDLDQLELMQSIHARFPLVFHGAGGPEGVIATGIPVSIQHTDGVRLHEFAKDEEHHDRLRRLELSSYVCAPIIALGKTLGAISFGTAASSRRYAADDVAVVQDVARRIGSAVESARSYAIAARERSALEHANRTKDEFLAVVSHELRTPLNSILGWVQLLRTGALSAREGERALEAIERGAQSQAQLIADLLDVSRIISGKLHLSLEAVDFAGVVTSVVESMLPAAQVKHIEIATNLCDSPPPLSGDPERLKQVVRNLLSNAIKFTPNGGRIAVELRSAGDELCLEVRDTGVGIAADFLPHVFDRFVQADSSTTRSYGGLGLGLSIVQHIVTLHRGEVRASSAGEGQGATFYVRLPVAPARALPVPVRAREAHATIHDLRPLAGIDILLVEDQEDGRELFRAIVERAGASVTAVASVHEALEAFAKQVPDLLVSDIGLPDLDGFELIRRVRAFEPERGGRVPAIAITAHASDHDQVRVRTAGFQGYLAKPVDREALLHLIQEVATASSEANGSQSRARLTNGRGGGSSLNKEGTRRHAGG